METNRRSSIWAIVPLLLWAVYHWIETIQRIRRYYTPLPVWDYWDVAAHLERYRALDVSVLWVQHNEHRILFPEIVFALDMLLFRGQQIFPVCVSVLCYLGILAILGWILHASGRLSPSLQIAAVLLGAIIMGWQGSAGFLADTFLLQWTMLQFTVAASLGLLTFAKRSGGGWYFAASLAFAEVATFSSGNGMLLWPVLVLAALALRLPGKRTWLLAAVGVASIGLYFTGYRFSGSINLKNFFVYPLYSLDFVGAYLGMPFGGMKGTYFGVNLGLGGLGIAVTLFCIAARKRLLAAPASALFFGLYLFAVLTALLTAAGRMDPSDPHFLAAEAQRYLSTPLMNWAVLVMMVIWMSGACGWKIFSPAQICVLAAVLSLLGFPKLRWWLRDQDATFSVRQAATIALRDGIVDPNLILKVFPDPNVVQPLIRELRDKHLSVFSDRRCGLIGKPLQDSFRMLKQRGFGAVTYLHPVQSGIEVAGWVDSSRDREDAREIVLVNEAGLIVGFGSKLGDLFPDRLLGLQTPPSLGWVGFVNLSIESSFFQPYLIRKHQLVSLGEPVRVPEITAVAPENVGQAISGIAWTVNPGWKQHGELPAEGWLGTGPGGVYSSRRHWEGDHWKHEGPKENGVLTASFPAPAGQCLVLPLLHGPSVGGLSVMANGAAVSFQNGETAWTYARIPLHGAGATLTISAPHPENWLAVGEPRECQ
ncbi:MAG TPA: hypothetical protein VGG97_00645 [Bryobacteraceae bacterium]